MALSLLCACTFTAHCTTMDPRISYEIIHMPDHIKPMGVMGLHGLIDFKPWIYGGIGLYSAVSGEKGGYFALAVEGGLQHQLYRKIGVDGGLRVGGGGGHNTPVGGGLFVEPYVGLKYHFHDWNMGLYYSNIYFLTGHIASDQVGLELSAPFHFHYFTSDNYIAALSKVYFPDHQSTNLKNQPMYAPIEFLGVEVGHFITHSVFSFLNFSGAAHGNENGYADELIGVGYRVAPFHLSAWNGIVKMAVGSGGGGEINTGGGFIYNPALGVEYRFNPYFSMELNGGYIAALDGNFRATEAGVLLRYYFSAAESSDIDNKARLNAWRFRLLNQTYFKPQSNDGTINPTMQLLGVDVDYFISPHFYGTGQTAFAYQGKNTGGYFSGMLGIGAKTSTVKLIPLDFFGEILGGTAGGAGLSIGDGALIEPVAGLEYQFNKAIALQTSVGYLLALQGRFHPITMSIGLSYRFLD